MPKKFCLFLFFPLFFWIFFLAALSLAQGAPSGIATTYDISDASLTGDIVCFAEESGKLLSCNKAYDERVFGVLTELPQVVLRTSATDRPVAREGKVSVNVTAENGPIKAGDYITTSKIPGKGQKATELTGYVVGRSLEDLSGNEGQVEVALSPGPAIIIPRGNLLDQLGLTLLSRVQKPGGAALFIRYLTAGLLAVFVTFFAFNNFGKNITKGVEAIGRNPLAKNQIQIIVIINTLLVVVVTVGGIILSLAIIRL